MEEPIDIEQQGCESVIHDYDHDLLVTKVRCKEFPDSGRGDFRCRHAIDYSSYLHHYYYYHYHYVSHIRKIGGYNIMVSCRSHPPSAANCLLYKWYECDNWGNTGRIVLNFNIIVIIPRLINIWRPRIIVNGHSIRKIMIWDIFKMCLSGHILKVKSQELVCMRMGCLTLITFLSKFRNIWFCRIFTCFLLFV